MEIEKLDYEPGYKLNITATITDQAIKFENRCMGEALSLWQIKKEDVLARIQEADKLKAENEKLRDEAEGMRSNWYKAVEAVKNLRAEQEKAKTEITRLKHYEDKCHDCPIVCAKTEIIKAHEELEAVQAELEQVKRCIEIVENQRDQMKRERDAAIDCIYKIEDALDRGNDNDWAREHISEWESQKEV